MASWRLQWVWLTNSLIVISVLVLLGVVHFNVVPFPKFGFYCNDPKISHKFTGDTITMAYLFSATLGLPLLLMLVVEQFHPRASRWWRLGTWYGQYTFGLLLLIFTIEAAKSIVSEPRPHFLDTCRPDKAVNCTSGYIGDYTCTNLDAKAYRIRDSVRSFPSGHSALGFYASVFLIMFLQARIPEKRVLITPWLQCLSLLWAVFCALSRITDRRHHWWDVVIGSIFGVICGGYAVKRLCSDFQWEEASEESSEDSSSTGKTFSTRRLLNSTSSYTPPEEKCVGSLS